MAKSTTKTNTIKKKPARISTAIQKKAMVSALEKSLGIVSSACQKAKISRITHYHWMNEDPEYRKQVESIEDMALDFSETQLYKSIKNGSDTAIIFHLKTKGKKRGYIERSEVDATIKAEKQVIIIGGKEIEF